MPASKTEKDKRRGLRKQQQHLQRHRENISRQTLMEIIEACGATEAYRQLPKNDQWCISKFRVSPPRVVAAPDCGFGKKIVDEIAPTFTELLRNRFLILSPTKFKISYYDYLTIVSALLVHATILYEKRTFGSIEWNRALEPLILISNDPEINPESLIKEELAQIAAKASSIEKQFFWFKLRAEIGRLAKVQIEEYFELRRYPAESKRIQIDGNPRPAYRVGEYDPQQKEMAWLSLSTADLPYEPNAALKKYNVYIQSHALARLRERMAPFESYRLEAELVNAIRNPIIDRAPDNTLMIHYRFAGAKVGNLVAERIGEDIVIRTFLFLTQGGAPEGNAFNARLKIKAIERQYFGLDTVRTFVHTDVCTDPRIAALLNECGCGELIRLKKNIGALEQEEKYAAKLRRLLCLDEEDDKYLEYDQKSEERNAPAASSAPLAAPVELAPQAKEGRTAPGRGSTSAAAPANKGKSILGDNLDISTIRYSKKRYRILRWFVRLFNPRFARSEDASLFKEVLPPKPPSKEDMFNL
jgi:hypothetical protein